MSEYVTHLPCENLDVHLKKLSKSELKIIAFCMIKSQSLNAIIAFLDKPSDSTIHKITRLANMGYLANVTYHVNGDTFTTLNHDATRFKTYPAIRSDRINIPTTRQRLHGGYN